MGSQISFFCTPTYHTETSFLVNIGDWGKVQGQKLLIPGSSITLVETRRGAIWWEEGRNI